MGATTPTYAIPYPGLTDAPDVPYWAQQLAERVDTLLARERKRAKIVRPAAAQSIPNATVTTVDFAGGSIAYDGDAMADLANDALVVKTAGWWRFVARVAWPSNATGYRGHLIVRGAADFLADDYRQAANGQSTIAQFATEPVLCAVNDVVKLQVVQASTVALNLADVNGRGTYLAAEFLGS